jgi:hypothetical protein
MDVPDIARELLQALERACEPSVESHNERSALGLKAYIEDLGLALGAFSSRPQDLEPRDDYELDKLATLARNQGAEVDQMMLRVRRVFGNRKKTCYTCRLFLMVLDRIEGFATTGP